MNNDIITPTNKKYSKDLIARRVMHVNVAVDHATTYIQVRQPDRPMKPAAKRRVNYAKKILNDPFIFSV